MAFARLQALEGVLEELKCSETYLDTVQEQCRGVVRDIRALGKVEISEAAPILALIQQCKHCSKEQRETLVGAVRQKLRSPERQSRAGKACKTSRPSPST